MNIIKKIFLLPFMILSFVTFSLNVYAVDEGYFRYEEYNDGVVITSAGARKIEQIPEYLGDKKVVRLDKIAFYACWNDGREIIIPEYVTEIEDECFLGVGGRDYTTYYVPAGIKYIGKRALGYYSPHFITNPAHWHEITRNPLVIILGYKNTVAESYANENGFKFIALDEEPEIPTTEPTEEPTEPIQPTETTETTVLETTTATETTLTEATEVTTETTLTETIAATETTDATSSFAASETTVPVTSTTVESVLETTDTVSTYITTETIVTTTTSTATLPETGYSKWYHDLIAAAVGMVGVGSAAIIKSGVFRKKKN